MNMEQPQYHTGLTRKAMQGVHYALLAGSQGRVYDIIKKHRKDVVARYPKDVEYGRRAPWAIIQDKEGFKYGVFCTQMGPAAVDIIYKEILDVCDPPFDVIRIGTGGTMQPDVSVGDMAIATGAIRAENTSFYWALSRDDDYIPLASPRIVAGLEQACDNLGLGKATGVKVTKASLSWEVGNVPMSKEVRMFLDFARDRGVVSSSMESSVIYTLGRVFNQKSELHNQTIFSNDSVGSISSGTIAAILNNSEEETLFADDKAAIKKAEKNVVKAGIEGLRVLNRDRVSSKINLESRAQRIEKFAPDYQEIIRLAERKLTELHPKW